MHQHLLRLSNEAAALDTEIKAVVGKMEAATAEADRAMYRVIYDNLVADKRELNAMRAALITQLAGRSVRESSSAEQRWEIVTVCYWAQREAEIHTVVRMRGDSPRCQALLLSLFFPRADLLAPTCVSAWLRGGEGGGEMVRGEAVTKRLLGIKSSMVPAGGAEGSGKSILHVPHPATCALGRWGLG